MKIAKFDGHSKISIVDHEDPTPDDKSVILKVGASALCGSELYSFRGDLSDMDGRLNSGHEVAGEIVYAPEGSGYEVGQRVGARIVQGCGDCKWCDAGDETACENKTFWGGNGHGEMFKLGLQGVHVLPEGIDWPRAVLLSGDGMGVPARAARKLGDTSGKTVLVIGLGPIGLACAMVQAFRGARVIGADLAPYRLNLVKECGAEDAIDVSKEDVLERVMDWTDGDGVDVVILAVPRQQSLELSFQCVKRYGTVFQVAELEKAELNFSQSFLRREANMMGSWYYTSEDWQFMLQLHHDGLQYEKLITHVLPLEKAQEAFDVFAAGESGKVVLTP